MAIGMLLAAAVSGGYLGVLQLTGNIHALVPHQLHRSAQPIAGEIDTLEP